MCLLDSPMTKTPHNLISLVNLSWGHWDKMMKNRGASNMQSCIIMRWSGQCMSSDVLGLFLPLSQWLLGQSPAKSVTLNKLYCSLGFPAPAWSSSPARLTRRFYNWIRRQEVRSVQIKSKPGVNLLNRRSHLLSRQCSNFLHIDGKLCLLC